MENNTKQIVLIGGGYASIWAYRSIVNELLMDMIAGRVRLTVICPEEFHFFHGWTAESFAGIIRDQNRMSPLKDIFKYAILLEGKVSRIETDAQQLFVEMNNGEKKTIHYDQLMMGMGSSDKTGITGLAEHGYQLKSHAAYESAKLRVRFLLARAAEADPAIAGKLLRFVVAGCGYTGVEMASSLAEMIKTVSKEFPSLQNIRPMVTLVNSARVILPGLQPQMNGIRNYTNKVLRYYGIEIIQSSRITRVTGKGAYLENGSFIESGMVITTIGQTRILLNGTENLERDAEKRIITNQFLQVNNHQNIWGAGDAVHVTHPGSKSACPSNALWAINQGTHAGKNIARAILDEPLKPFRFKGLGQCASLGIGKGIGELYGFEFTGWVAWIMRWFFFQYYMPSKKIMWREIGDWARLFLTRRRVGLDIRTVPITKNKLPKWRPSLGIVKPGFQKFHRA